MDEAFYLIALRYLQYRSRSIKEVIDHLKKKNTPDEQITIIIKKLEEQRFLNDEEFAKMWIRNRTTLRPTGKHLLKLELMQKGIEKNIIDKVLEEASEESGSDLEMARILTQKKKEKFKNMTKDERYRKLGGFLQRRGFSYDVIKRSIDEVFGK